MGKGRRNGTEYTSLHLHQTSTFISNKPKSMFNTLFYYKTNNWSGICNLSNLQSEVKL